MNGLHNIIINKIIYNYNNIIINEITYNILISMFNLWLYSKLYLYKNDVIIKINIIYKNAYFINHNGIHYEKMFEKEDILKLISNYIEEGYIPTTEVDTKYELFDILVNRSTWNHEKYPLLI